MTGCPELAFYPGQEKAASVKAAWKRFLKEHGPAIREGKHFSYADYSTLER